MDSSSQPFRPSTEEDWVQYREVFIRHYIDEDLTLEQTRNILREVYHFDPSEKQCKNQIKRWKVRKYLRHGEAQKIVDGTIRADGVLATTQDPEAARKKAERAVKRRLARMNRQGLENSRSDGVGNTAQQVPGTLIHRSSSLASVASPKIPHHIPTNLEKLLFNLRKYTYEAYTYGHWDSEAAPLFQKGRQASRSLSTDLTAGRSLFQEGKNQQAMQHWHRARQAFQDRNLLDTWYYETPIRLLFELARMMSTGHREIAASLLNELRVWSETYLEEDDSRRALFTTISDMKPEDLQELHSRAARCLYEGLASRFEKRHHLRYEVRLNRALDLLWFDAKADLSEWLPSIEEVDEDLGVNNEYSVYFLLLHAYRQAATEKYAECEQICAEVEQRLQSIKQAQCKIDHWKVGLAYRRLGRQLHSAKRYDDARRTLSKALKYIKNKSAVLVEICQYQVSMAQAQGDEMDVLLWQNMLESMERANQQQKTENSTAVQLYQPHVPDSDIASQRSAKRRRLDIPMQQYPMQYQQQQQQQQQHPPPPQYGVDGVEEIVRTSFPDPTMNIVNGEYAMRENMFSDQSGMPDMSEYVPNGSFFNEPMISPTSTYNDFTSLMFSPDTTWNYGQQGFGYGGTSLSQSGPSYMPSPTTNGTRTPPRSMTA